MGFDKVESICRGGIQKLHALTPGDFAAVKRQDKFNPIKSAKDFLKRLENEVSVKGIEQGRKMGFM